MMPSSAIPDETGATTLRSRVLVGLAQLLSKRWASSVDLAIATNEITAKALGLPPQQLEPNVMVDAARPQRSGSQADLLMVGLLIPRKRPWIALHSLADPRLSDRQLTIVGDGPLRNDLEALAERLGVEARVSFLGELPRNEVLQMMTDASVLIHPAAREGAAWVVGEAAAVGLPAIVFAESGAGSTVELSDNGGQVISGGEDPVTSLVSAIVRQTPPGPTRLPSSRWSPGRLQSCFDRWWGAPNDDHALHTGRLLP
jgi:glycosyltransferase involved in cell wall biosynthesis